MGLLVSCKKTIKKTLFQILAPLNLYGEGNYALTAVKEIDATEDYLEMSKDITKCQNVISSEDCQTDKYIEEVLEKCLCLPANFAPIY